MKSFSLLLLLLFIGFFSFVQCWKYTISQDVVDSAFEAKKSFKEGRNQVRERSIHPRMVLSNHWIVKITDGADIHELSKHLGLNSSESSALSFLPNTFRLENLGAQEDEFILENAKNHEHIQWIHRDTIVEYEKRAPQDEPRYGNQWHLKNTGQGGGVSGTDANVEPAWAQGVSGEGVQICIIDDGLNHAHNDFEEKYVAEDSYDPNGGDSDPSPGDGDNHGTACGGVAAASEEGTCGVGPAYKARISGIRAIAGPISNTDLAEALIYHFDKNDIYSCSWGVPACGPFGNNGRRACQLVELSPVLQQALEEGVAEGRDGKGSIWVFAAGNDRQAQSSSNVNYQDLTRVRYTISVAALSNLNEVSSYSDPGCANLVSAPSNGGTLGITTTDRLGNVGYDPSECTDSFGGTSSACPLVAGVIGLMLEANPSLRWIDVQDIIARTSARPDPDSPEWQTNGAGLHVSHDFGLGSIDADASVKMAKKYDSPNCDQDGKSAVKEVGSTIPDNDPNGITSKLKVSGIEVDQVYHTYCHVVVTHQFPGDLIISLKSPAGTVSVFTQPRLQITANIDFEFVTTFNWGEEANGEWELSVVDALDQDVGTLQSWDLTFYGSCSPNKLSKGQVAGIVIGVLFAITCVLLIAALAVWIVFRKKKNEPIVPDALQSKIKMPAFGKKTSEVPVSLNNNRTPPMNNQPVPPRGAPPPHNNPIPPRNMPMPPPRGGPPTNNRGPGYGNPPPAYQGAPMQSCPNCSARKVGPFCSSCGTRF